MSYIAWNTQIVNRLKSGSVKSVVLYGDSDAPRPASPYIVVKPVSRADAKGLEIYAHFAQGEQDALESYLIEELPALLKEPLDAGEDRVFVIDTRSYNPNLAISDDNTISGMRLFYIPQIL